jgi:hypothetical protein
MSGSYGSRYSAGQLRNRDQILGRYIGQRFQVSDMPAQKLIRQIWKREGAGYLVSTKASGYVIVNHSPR